MPGRSGSGCLLNSTILKNLPSIDYLREVPAEFQSHLREAEEALGYRFHDKRLLCKALMHSSYVNEHPTDGVRHNERVEFLGDAVLSLILSEYLFRHYPDRWEGELSLMRSWLVSEATLARIAQSIKLPAFILLGNGEDTTGGRERTSLHADVLEALIGSVYLDGGGTEATRIILRLFKDMLRCVDEEKESINCKNALQAKLHSIYHMEPEYRIIRTEGPDHMKQFDVEVRINGTVLGSGSGFSKKEAEMNAAAMALEYIEEQRTTTNS